MWEKSPCECLVGLMYDIGATRFVIILRSVEVLVLGLKAKESKEQKFKEVSIMTLSLGA